MTPIYELAILAIVLVALWLKVAKRSVAISILIALLGVFSWLNFSPTENLSKIHLHDTFHYYVGSKYFDELKYTGLYDCALSASVDNDLSRQEKLSITYRNLADNSYLTKTAAELKDVPCRKNFSQERWVEFSTDVKWFENGLGPEKWQALFMDHGFNATPLWIAFGRLISSISSPNYPFFIICNLICLTLVLFSFLFCASNFGLFPCAIAMVLWGAGFLNDFSWTGGSFFRDDWIVLTLCSLAFLRSEKKVLGITFLTLAAGLRVFPIIPLLVVIAYQVLILKDLESKKLLKTISPILLIVLFTFCITGFSSWQLFKDNTLKHEGTRSRNSISVMDTVDNLLYCKFGDAAKEGGSCDLSEKRGKTLSTVSINLLGLILGFLALRRSKSSWKALLIGFSVIPWLIPLSSYYYAFLALFGFEVYDKPKATKYLVGINIALWVLVLGLMPQDKVYLFSGALIGGFTLWYLISSSFESKANC